jgi:hypothetical protein
MTGYGMRITRRSIAEQVREAVEARGLTFGTRCEANGPLRYIIGGEVMSPGEAADKYLPGGFALNFGKAVSR